MYFPHVILRVSRFSMILLYNMYVRERLTISWILYKLVVCWGEATYWSCKLSVFVLYCMYILKPFQSALIRFDGYSTNKGIFKSYTTLLILRVVCKHVWYSTSKLGVMYNRRLVASQTFVKMKYLENVSLAQKHLSIQWRLGQGTFSKHLYVFNAKVFQIYCRNVLGDAVNIMKTPLLARENSIDTNREYLLYWYRELHSVRPCIFCM